MFKIFNVKRFKSIKELNVDVGSFNVIIGENGAGKSNFLEALAVFSAGLSNKLSSEFFKNRGIRYTQANNLFSTFSNKTYPSSLISGIDQMGAIGVILSYDPDEPYPEVKHELGFGTYDKDKKSSKFFYSTDGNDELEQKINELYEDIAKRYGSVEEYDRQLTELMTSTGGMNIKAPNQLLEDLARITPFLNIQRHLYSYRNKKDIRKKGDFVIYSPELSELKVFYKESQIDPLSAQGAGLFKLLITMEALEPEKLKKVFEIASIFQWVDEIGIQKDGNNVIEKLKIKDFFMGCDLDHNNVNEGFLFVLFYATLFSSQYTPDFFAIDNIDASLNPKLCRVLIKELIKLAKENGKQAFVTTHNPAILDGLDLHDDDQRLFVVERKDEGDTTLRRIGIDDLPKPTRSGQTIKLSEAFMRGLLGGLPTNF